TSRSRMPTMPCEFRLRTWLPAMPAYTAWISQPAISSASSTARWMDCTVDSMLTTTPRLRPREGCEPRPTISMLPSAPISPTSATTFDVPISSPTIRGRSLRFATRGSFGRAPAHGKAVGIAQVHIVDFTRTRRDHARTGLHEAVEALINLFAAQPQRHAVVQRQLPGAALIQRQARQAHAGFDQAWIRGQIACGHGLLLTLGARQHRQLRRNVAGVVHEHLAAHIEQALFAPARHRRLFHHQHGERVGPAARHAGTIHPRD